MNGLLAGLVFLPGAVASGAALEIDYDRLLWPFSFALGAIVGSFLNAFIYRWPFRISMWKVKRSFCPRCKHTIAWYDNIPILSYILLRGRCRHCNKPIHVRYLAVEVLTSALFGLTFYHCRILNRASGLYTWPHTAVLLAMIAALIGVGFVDCMVRRIPNEITIPAIIAAPVISFLVPELHAFARLPDLGSLRVQALVDCLGGIILCGGGLWLLGVVGSFLLKKEAMGFGDVKLMAMIGGLWGWANGIFVIVAGAVVGSFVGGAFFLLTGRRKVPFGPFLAIGAAIVFFWGPLIAAWYWGLITGQRQFLAYRVPFIDITNVGGW